MRKIRLGRPNKANEAANLVSGIVYGNIRRFSVIPGVVHFLFAGNDTEGTKLYDIYPDGSIQEIDKFVASGSGSMFAFGVFESQYEENMSEKEAVDLAKKAVNAALQRDSASGGGIDVVVINKDGVKKVYHKQVSVDVT